MRRVIKTVVACTPFLVFASFVRADMMLAEAHYDQFGLTRTCREANHCETAGFAFGNSLVHAGPITFLPQMPARAQRGTHSEPIHVLVDTNSSLSLCLYALLGVGLCSSGHWIKKVSLGAIPHWYHDGGPSQIGHSLAICPHRLYPEAVCCFVHPELEEQEPSPQYHRGLIEPLLRKSLFTLSVLASRSPPNFTYG
jgi:hypothetical protein